MPLPHVLYAEMFEWIVKCACGSWCVLYTYCASALYCTYYNCTWIVFWIIINVCQCSCTIISILSNNSKSAKTYNFSYWIFELIDTIKCWCSWCVNCEYCCCWTLYCETCTYSSKSVINTKFYFFAVDQCITFIVPGNLNDPRWIGYLRSPSLLSHPVCMAQIA